MASYSAINTSAEVIIAGGQIFKMAASRFVDVSEAEINLMKENAIPRNTKHATRMLLIAGMGNGERVPGNRERESGNKCTAATLFRV